MEARRAARSGAGGTGRRGRLSGVALVAVLALLAGGCHFHTDALQHQQTSPDTRPWWCHSTGTGGHHVEPAYDGMTKGMLSWDDCLALSQQLDAALEYAKQWPTLGDAEAAGFHRQVSYVEGMGTHHALLGDFGGDDVTAPGYDPHEPTFPGTALDEEFDPTRPEFLQYGGTGPGARLVGMSWYVRTDDGLPPEGFPGDNDWWHRHHRLCHSVDQFRVIGEDLTDEQCANRGGVNLHLDDYWMVHAWIVDGWQTEVDVFTNHHPCLLSTGPAGPEHSCWDETGHTGHTA